MRRGGYKQIPRDYTQDLIQKMIQTVIHLKYYVPPRNPGVRQDGFQVEYNGTKIAVYPNGIDFGIGDTGYVQQIKWELHMRSDAQVPDVVNVTPINDDVRQQLGSVLRYWMDTEV